MQAIAGRMCRGLAAPDPELRFARRVLAIIILRAIEDAQRGDGDALAWLDSTGRRWLALLGVPAPDDWRAAGERLPAARREMQPESATAEYWRQYRAARRDDPAYQERERARWARTNAKRRAERGEAGRDGRVPNG